MACMEGAAAGELKVGFCLGGNLYGSNPDASYAAKSLGNLDLIVYLSTTLNTGHAHGLARETIILPVLARDEEPQPTTQESMFNYVRLSDGGPRRHAGPRSEVEVIASIAAGVAHPSAVGSAGGSASSPTSNGDGSAPGRARGCRRLTGPPCVPPPKSARPSPASSPASKSWPKSIETKQEFQIAGRTFH